MSFCTETTDSVCSVSVMTASSSTTQGGLKTQVESILGQPVTDDNVSEVIKSLQGVFAAEQKLYRNHSFQLVKLQSEVHELRSQRAKDDEKIADLKSELQKLYTTMAELKGKFANLTIEMHASKNTAPASRLNRPEQTNGHQPHDTPKPPHHASTNGNGASPLPTVGRSGNSDIEALVDNLLLEQRPRLIQALKSVADVDPLAVTATSNQSTDLSAANGPLSSGDSSPLVSPENPQPVHARGKHGIFADEVPPALRQKFLERLTRFGI